MSSPGSRTDPWAYLRTLASSSTRDPLILGSLDTAPFSPHPSLRRNLITTTQPHQWLQLSFAGDVELAVLRLKPIGLDIF